MAETSPTPNITLSETTVLPTDQLDSLFQAIGWKPRGQDKWREVLDKSSHVLTVWDGERIIGMGRILEDGVMCMFYDIGVHPEYQKKGVGKKIMETLINKVKDKRYASIGLFAWDGNPVNEPFYESLGFERTSGMELVKYMTPE